MTADRRRWWILALGMSFVMRSTLTSGSIAMYEKLPSSICFHSCSLPDPNEMITFLVVLAYDIIWHNPSFLQNNPKNCHR